MGDGGIHPIAELNQSDLPATPAAEPTRDVLNLRAMTTSIMKSTRQAKEKTAQASRVSYVAPMEDFQAVLNMTMREPVAAHR
jgi:hypothetical protein